METQQRQPVYKKEFLEKIQYDENQKKKWWCRSSHRYKVVWTFVKMFFEQRTNYMYTCNDWELADEMKKALGLKPSYSFFFINHIYRYVDMQEEKFDITKNMIEKDVIGLIDYYSLDYKPCNRIAVC